MNWYNKKLNVRFECSQLNIIISYMTMPLESSSHTLLNMANTFDQINSALYELDEIDLNQYLDHVSKVPYDHEIARLFGMIKIDNNWINNMLNFLVEVSKYDPRAFNIELSSLDQLGFRMKEFSSKKPKWLLRLTNSKDDAIKKERRFLRYHRLLENVEYIRVIAEMDGVVVETGHRLTRIGLYRVISRQFGYAFLEALLSRMGQILYFYNQYKRNFKSKYIESLRRTIIDLTDDISSLNKEIAKKTVPIIEYEKYHENENIYHSCGSNDSSSIESNAVMDDKEYADELSAIHNMIETSINHVDDRISTINIALSHITSKIDDLVGSIAMVSEDSLRNSMDTSSRHSLVSQDHSRNSLLSDGSYGNMDLSVENPVINHVSSIFKKYQKHLSLNNYDSGAEL